MPRKPTEVPRFKSDADATDWYATPQGRRQTQREFERALKDGRLIRSTESKIAKTDPKVLELLMQQAKQKATRSISIRVPIADLEQAQRIAEATGIGYQTVLKQAIRKGLRRAG
jgi:predicted DNA binding CopG/RHH family protein